MCDFQAGDVVVCVDDSIYPEFPVSGLLGVHKGTNYVVSKVEFFQTERFGTLCGVFIEGYPSPANSGAFFCSRFRRVYRPNGTLIGKLLEPIATTS